jgi:hypothetical protein
MSVATDTVGLVPALMSAADERATGELSTVLPGGDPARIFIEQGQVYSVVVRDGGRSLGERLVASGALEAMDLELALAAQNSDVPGWRIGELVVHLGFVGTAQVRACLAEQMQEMLGWLLSQPPTEWRMRPGSRTRAAFATPLDVQPLLSGLGFHARPQPVPAARVELPPPVGLPDPLSDPLADAVTEAAAEVVASVQPTDAIAEVPDHDVATEDPAGAPPEEKLTLSIWRPFLPRQRTGKDKRGIFGRRQSKD